MCVNQRSAINHGGLRYRLVGSTGRSANYYNLARHRASTPCPAEIFLVDGNCYGHGRLARHYARTSRRDFYRRRENGDTERSHWETEPSPWQPVERHFARGGENPRPDESGSRERERDDTEDASCLQRSEAICSTTGRIGRSNSCETLRENRTGRLDRIGTCGTLTTNPSPSPFPLPPSRANAHGRDSFLLAAEENVAG